MMDDARWIPAGYKRTEVGVIPEDWEVDKLGNCLIGSPDYGVNAPAVPYKDGLPVYIRITDITDNGHFSTKNITSVKVADPGKYLLNSGELVFARTGVSVGKSYLYNPEDGELVFAGFLIRVKPNPVKLVPRFLSAYIKTGNYWNWVKSVSMRSGQPGINSTQYAKLPIPLPPLPEQRAIADVLSDVDALIAALDHLIAKKRAIQQGAMQQLLTGQTRLPGFSEPWETKTLGEAFQFLQTASNSRSDLSRDGDIKYIHYGDIHTKWDSFLDCANDSLPFIQQERLRKVPFLEDGDLVMADASEDYEGIGASIEVQNATGRKVVAGLHTILLRGDKNLLADGFKGYIQYIPSFKNALIKIATGTSVYGIAKTKIRQVSVDLPPLAEQRAIAEVLSDMDAEIAALEARRDKTRAIKQGMMQQLLTGRIRLV